MYTRQNPKRQCTVPENYGGTAFSESGDLFVPPPSDILECCENDGGEEEAKRKSSFPIKIPFFDIKGEDILLIGLIFLLAQSDMANDIIPILIILLFC